MNIFWRRRSIVLVLGLTVCGCGQRGTYIQPEPGPHGSTSVKRVKYTPEQMAAREAAWGPGPRQPADPDLADIEKAWPKLTVEQRAEVLRTVKTMSEQK